MSEVSETDVRSIFLVALMLHLHRCNNRITPDQLDQLLADIQERSPQYYDPEVALPGIRRFEEEGVIRVDWTHQDGEWTSMELLPSAFLPPGHVFSGDCCR